MWVKNEQILLNNFEKPPATLKFEELFVNKYYLIQSQIG